MGKAPPLLKAIIYPFPACLVSHCVVFFFCGDFVLLTVQGSKWPQQPVERKKIRISWMCQ